MKIFVFIAVFLAFAVSAAAQTNAEIEKELVAAIKEVKANSAYRGDHDQEKLDQANRIFEEKLVKYTKIPSTLAYQFSALDEDLYIAASDDGRFRVFSWDMEGGGTMHFFGTVYQYRGADGKVYSKARKLDEGEPGSFVYDVFTLDTKGGKVYMVATTGIYSSMDNSQAVKLFKVTGKTLTDNVKLIKTKSGLTNMLGFGYNFFSVVDRKERPVKLISFDKKTKTLRIPVVVEDEGFPNGKVTDKFISYRFNGTYFVKVN
jgi:hypothetical protein